MQNPCTQTQKRIAVFRYFSKSTIRRCYCNTLLVGNNYKIYEMTAQSSKIKVHTMIYVQYQVMNTEDIALQKM